MQSVENNFTRREWLLVIALLLMVEYWVVTRSYTFAEEQLVLNYISFAGTISSILLAVLAIIYGFYQSHSQQQVSNQILSQVDNLRSVSEKLQESPIKFGLQLDRIDNITNKLDSIDLGVGQSQGQLSEIKSQLSEIRNLQEDFKASSLTATQIDLKISENPQQLSKAILGASTYDADVFACSLAQYIKSHPGEKNISSLFLDKYFVEPLLKTERYKNSRAQVLATGIQIYSILRSVQLLNSIGASEEEITDAVVQTLPDLCMASRNSQSKWVKEAITYIDQIEP